MDAPETVVLNCLLELRVRADKKMPTIEEIQELLDTSLEPHIGIAVRKEEVCCITIN